MGSICIVDLTKTDPATFSKTCSDCVMLTRDGKLLLQQRPANWSGAGCLVPFGGHLEPGETPLQGMIRELNEELGAVVNPADVISLGAITEADTGHTVIVHLYFSHDKAGTIPAATNAKRLITTAPPARWRIRKSWITLSGRWGNARRGG